jgi:hypothetical protein
MSRRRKRWKKKKSVKQGQTKPAAARRIPDTQELPLQPPSPPQLPEPARRGWPGVGAKVLWTAFGVVAGLASIVAVFPRFSIAVDAPLDPADVLTTPFLVTYEGYFPVANVQYSCVRERVIWEGRIFSEGDTITTADRPRLVQPGDAQTISCHEGTFPTRGRKIRLVDISIRVSYDPFLLPFIHRESVFLFHGTRQSDGGWRWFRQLPAN